MLTKRRIAKEWLILLGVAVISIILIFVVAAIQVFHGDIPKGLYLYKVLDRIVEGGWVYIALFFYAVFQFIRLTVWAFKTLRSKEA